MIPRVLPRLRPKSVDHVSGRECEIEKTTGKNQKGNRSEENSQVAEVTTAW